MRLKSGRQLAIAVELNVLAEFGLQERTGGGQMVVDTTVEVLGIQTMEVVVDDDGRQF